MSKGVVTAPLADAVDVVAVEDDLDLCEDEDEVVDESARRTSVEDDVEGSAVNTLGGQPISSRLACRCPVWAPICV